MRLYFLSISLNITLLIVPTLVLFSQEKHNNLNGINFFNSLISTPNHVIIDVQTVKEFKKCHIINAINAPKKEILLEICDTLSKDTEIFIYCSHGERSEAGKTIIEKKGFQHVYNLKYGIEPLLNDPTFRQFKNLIYSKH